MPTYEYKCDACGNAFEKFQQMSADPIKKCPACGKNKVKRLIGTGAGLIFKGSGFYITDYRDAGYQDKAKAESGGGASTDTKSGDGKSSEAKAGDAKSADTKSGEATSKSAAPADAKPAAKAESKSSGGDKPASGGGDKPSGGSSSSKKKAS